MAHTHCFSKSNSKSILEKFIFLSIAITWLKIIQVNLSGREDEECFLSHWSQTQEEMNTLEEQDDITGIGGIKGAKVKFIERFIFYIIVRFTVNG